MKKPLLRTLKFLFAGALVIGIALSALGDWEHIPGQMGVTILQTPAPMMAKDKTYLVYKLYLTNFNTSPLTLTQLTITTPNNATPLFTFKGNDLTALLRKNDPAQKPTLTIEAGKSVTVFMRLPFANISSMPDELVHRFVFNTTHNSKALTLTTTTDPMRVQKHLR